MRLRIDDQITDRVRRFIEERFDKGCSDHGDLKDC
jgi:hypothetical protein